MGKKSGTEVKWIIFSVITVVVPVLIGIALSSYINSKLPALNEIMDSFILIVFSVASSLLSICYEVSKQEKKINVMLWISAIIMGFTWTLYVISLTQIIVKFEKIIFIALCITTTIFSWIGIRLCKKSDKNDNEKIKAMHDNCDKIRKELIIKKYNDKLAPFNLREDDLLCNPDEFDRIEETLKIIVSDGEKEK